MTKTVRYLWLACLSFLLAVTSCIILDPPDWLSHDGFSFYGNFKATIIPYGVGLAACAYFLLRATRDLRGTQAARSFKIGLEFIAIGLLGIVVTPSYSQVTFIQDLHVLFGLVIFVTQAALSLGYLIKIRGAWLDWLLLVAQLVAIIVVALSFRSINILQAMLLAQVLAIVAFMGLLIRAVQRNNTASVSGS